MQEAACDEKNKRQKSNHLCKALHFFKQWDHVFKIHMSTKRKRLGSLKSTILVTKSYEWNTGNDFVLTIVSTNSMKHYTKCQRQETKN